MLVATATAADVASAVRHRVGDIDTRRLLKLVYYCQAWHLAWYGVPLFDDELEAWQQGPVVRSVWKHVPPPASPEDLGLSEQAQSVLQHVLSVYGRLGGLELSKITHIEFPYVAARGGLPPDAPSSEPLDHDFMREYYRRLPLAPERAAEYAAANASLEGLEVTAELAGRLREVADGTRTDDDAVADLLAARFGRH